MSLKSSKRGGYRENAGVIFKKGDMVRHKNIPNERLQVFKIGDGVLIVDRISEPKMWYGGRQVMDFKKYICAVENIYHEKI